LAAPLLTVTATGCLLGSLLGCVADADPTPAVAEKAPALASGSAAPSAKHAPVPVVAEVFKPARLRQWPKLDAWLQGRAIDREPHTGEPLMAEQTLAARGKVLFGMYCYQCHGNDGRGDGPRSPLFEPAPRDFTQATFKFRSTPSGELPTRTDLFRTITGGLRGTGMMAFADLPEEHRWALVEYLRTLSPRFADHGESAAVAVPEVPLDLDASWRVAAGRQAYGQLGCAQCHGPDGRGDGMAAATLRDVKGRRLPPPDFATRPAKWSNHAGGLYRTLATGLDGTAMPAYATSAEPEALWNVVAFVQHLSRELPARVDPKTVAEAELVMGKQAKQGRHAVVDGCGCAARRRAQQAQKTATP
jgi:cytochrome c oxidase cbb3-type subunit 2